MSVNLLAIVIILFVSNLIKPRCYRIWEQNKLKGYLALCMFAVFIVLITVVFFLWLKQPNLYNLLGISRKSSGTQIDQAVKWQKKQFLNSLDNQGITPQQKIQQITQIGNILKHPARRLMYDSFNMLGLQTVWSILAAFIIQRIASDTLNIIINFLIIMIISERPAKTTALQYNLMFIGCIFIISTHMNLTCEKRLLDWYDILDEFLPPLTIYERHQYLNTLILPFLDFFQFAVMLLYKSKYDKLIQQYYLTYENLVLFLNSNNINAEKLMKMTPEQRSDFISNLQNDPTLKEYWQEYVFFSRNMNKLIKVCNNYINQKYLKEHIQKQIFVCA